MGRSDQSGFTRAERLRWLEQVEKSVQRCPGEDEFDARFIRYLLSQLDERGYTHLSHAVLRSGLDVAANRCGRLEFDALVDLAIQLVAQGRWDIPAALPAGGAPRKAGSE
ncbi:hypothetical protein [Frigidibacter sp. ROC022]|uniref:hypothetical protein n=1 Tax=Frigidibacter sp. ROC022 TaxID=2971796 RepID=UPI00215AF7CA|nr:hypothetical protein [Frigidibacter sp. ROC022]MCR8723750.1 hypothetical protein [Frigidibacter sp. ROC022]